MSAVAEGAIVVGVLMLRGLETGRLWHVAAFVAALSVYWAVLHNYCVEHQLPRALTVIAVQAPFPKWQPPGISCWNTVCTIIRHKHAYWF